MKTLHEMTQRMKYNCDRSMIKGRDLAVFNAVLVSIENMGLEARILEFHITQRVRTRKGKIVLDPEGEEELRLTTRDSRNYEKISIQLDGPKETVKEAISYLLRHDDLAKYLSREGKGSVISINPGAGMTYPAYVI